MAINNMMIEKIFTLYSVDDVTKIVTICWLKRVSIDMYAFDWATTALLQGYYAL